MKKIYVLLMMISAGLFVPSCSNEIILVDEWKDIPIVYGLLSRADTAHYFRVEKAFLDPNTSALEIAQNPDSLYYDNVTVELQKVNSTDPAYILQKVNGNLEGYQREPGVFADAPNYLYKLKLPQGEELEEGATYEIRINRGDDLEVVTAETNIVHDLRILTPVPKDPPDVPLAIKFDEYNEAISVRWRAKSTSKFFDLKFILHINEFDGTNPNVAIPIDLVWTIESNIIAGTPSNGQGDISESETIVSEDFYRFIGTKLQPKAGFFRRFESIDIVIDAGGEELLNYVTVGNVNTGITSSQVIPTYTNLSEGLGLFSSRNQVIGYNFPVSGTTIDSLVNGIYTKDLNFEF